MTRGEREALLTRDDDDPERANARDARARDWTDGGDEGAEREMCEAGESSWRSVLSRGTRVATVVALAIGVCACAAVCANVCKHPTQKFFTEEIGLPVTLTPNYETFECQFSYGATPPDPADDVAFSTPCFRQCPASETLGDESCGNLKDC